MENLGKKSWSGLFPVQDVCVRCHLAEFPFMQVFFSVLFVCRCFLLLFILFVYLFIYLFIYLFFADRTFTLIS